MEPAQFSPLERNLVMVAVALRRGQWPLIITVTLVTGFFVPVPGPSWVAFVVGVVAAFAVLLAANEYVSRLGGRVQLVTHGDVLAARAAEDAAARDYAQTHRAENVAPGAARKAMADASWEKWQNSITQLTEVTNAFNKQMLAGIRAAEIVNRRTGGR